VKNAIIGYRWLTRDTVEPTRIPTTPEELAKHATLQAAVLSDAPPDAPL
jgi:hypothetical protein